MIFALIHFGILFTLQMRVFGAGDELPTVVQNYRESQEGSGTSLSRIFWNGHFLSP
jgi:hypothetical protein